MTKRRTIDTMNEAFAELGGPRKIATYLGVDEGAVGNWRDRKFPAWTHLALTDAFEQLGIALDPRLCNQHYPAVTWAAVRDGRASYQSKRKKPGNGKRR